ncbi:MAG: hypothetical protein JWQ71_3918 [Pedosphaera sp.]|nr:hypothetical protein [Pedosphaera sp.]
MFGFVAVGDESAKENGGGTGHVGEAIGNVAAGAGFSGDDGLLAFGEEADNDFLKLLVLGAEDLRADLLAHELLGIGDELFGTVAASDEADIDGAVMGAVADFQSGIHERLQWADDFFFNDGFAQAGGQERAADECAFEREFLAEQGKDVVGEHGPHFAGRTGKHDEPTGFAIGAERIGSDFHGEAGSGAVGIVEDERAFGNLSLDGGADGHGAAALGKEGFETSDYGRVFMQAFAEETGDEIAGDVVGSGAEAAGYDDEIGAGKGFTDGGLNGVAGISNGNLAGGGVAGVGELAADPLLMGVEDEAEHQLAAGVDYFDIQCKGTMPAWGRRFKGWRD